MNKNTSTRLDFTSYGIHPEYNKKYFRHTLNRGQNLCNEIQSDWTGENMFREIEPNEWGLGINRNDPNSIRERYLKMVELYNSKLISLSAVEQYISEMPGWIVADPLFVDKKDAEELVDNGDFEL